MRTVEHNNFAYTKDPFTMSSGDLRMFFGNQPIRPNKKRKTDELENDNDDANASARTVTVIF